MTFLCHRLVPMACHQLLRRLSPLLHNASFRLQTLRPELQGCGQTFTNHLKTVRFMTSNVTLEIVNIQDEEDFQKRVMESKKPVVVDFHAR